MIKWRSMSMSRKWDPITADGNRFLNSFSNAGDNNAKLLLGVHYFFNQFCWISGMQFLKYAATYQQTNCNLHLCDSSDRPKKPKRNYQPAKSLYPKWPREKNNFPGKNSSMANADWGSPHSITTIKGLWGSRANSLEWILGNNRQGIGTGDQLPKMLRGCGDV